MTTELQNKVWSILPKEFKEEVKKEYKVSEVGTNLSFVLYVNPFFLNSCIKDFLAYSAFIK